MSILRPGPAFFAASFLVAILSGCGNTGSGTSTPTPPAGTPAATLSTTTLTFSAPTLNTASATQAVTLTNSGTATLTISGIILSGTDASYYTLTNSCASTLAAGSSCTFAASFKATDLNTRAATITVATNATPASQTVSLTGGGSTLASKCGPTVPRKALPTASASYPGAALNGKVIAGSRAVMGATVQLYAAGNSGNGLAPTALGPALTTDSNGGFSLTAAYTCPFNLSTLYLVSRGGKAAGTTRGTSDPNTVLMTVLGPCNALTTATGLVINEATTVAAAFSMSQFLSAGGNVGASSTNFNGLKLAAASAANLVNAGTGTAPGAAFPSTGTPPTLNLNALANVLNACIVGTPASTCTQLYAATAVSGASPSNTLDALLNLARHPATNVAALYTLSAGSTAFAPSAPEAPSDWTLFNTFTGAGMNAPSGLGIDSAGNVAVSNYFSVASLFTTTGTPIVPGGVTGNNLLNTYGLAIDQADQVWIPNEQSPYAINSGLGSITVLSTAAYAPTAVNYSAGGLNYPVAVAFDSSQTAWVVDYGNSHVTLLNPSGTPLSGASGYTTPQFAFPVAVATDSKCYGYIANQSSSTITRVANDGSSFASFTTGSGASGLAVDAADNVWVANYYGDSIGLLSSNGIIISSGLTGGGLNHPQGIAIDGAGNAWIANYRGPALSEFAAYSASIPAATLSPSTGYGKDAQLNEAFAIAIDAAGNIWVTNFGNNTLTEFIGLAAPVRTPLIGPVALP